MFVPIIHSHRCWCRGSGAQLGHRDYFWSSLVDPNVPPKLRWLLVREPFQSHKRKVRSTPSGSPEMGNSPNTGVSGWDLGHVFLKNNKHLVTMHAVGTLCHFPTMRPSFLPLLHWTVPHELRTGGYRPTSAPAHFHLPVSDLETKGAPRWWRTQQACRMWAYTLSFGH